MMKSSLSRLARHNLSTIILSRLGTSIAGLTVGIALAQTLGPAGLGIYSSLVASSIIAGTFLCMGMETPYNLRAARNPDAGRNLLLMVAAQAALSIPVTVIIWMGLSRAGLAPLVPPPLFVLAVSALVLNQLSQPVMNGLQKQAWVNTVMAVLLLAQATAIVALSHTNAKILQSAIMIYVTVLVSMYVFALFSQFKKQREEFPYWKIAAETTSEGRHYLVATVCGIIRLRANVMIISWHLPSSDIGNFQVMQSLTEMLYLVPVTISIYIISSKREGYELFREAKSAAIASFIITLACVLLIMISLPLVIPSVYGPGFRNVVRLGPIMISAALPFAIAKGISAYISRVGQARIVTKVEFTTTVISLGAIFPLIRYAGLEGAIWSFVIAAWAGAFGYAGFLLHLRARDKTRYSHSIDQTSG